MLRPHRGSLARLITGAQKVEYALPTFMAARASIGGCALVLSGGATFGIFHFGVVKALVELKLLPPVVCGASAGAVVVSTEHLVLRYSAATLRRALSEGAPCTQAYALSLHALGPPPPLNLHAADHRAAAAFASPTSICHPPTAHARRP